MFFCYQVCATIRSCKQCFQLSVAETRGKWWRISLFDNRDCQTILHLAMYTNVCWHSCHVFVFATFVKPPWKWGFNARYDLSNKYYQLRTVFLMSFRIIFVRFNKYPEKTAKAKPTPCKVSRRLKRGYRMSHPRASLLFSLSIFKCNEHVRIFTNTNRFCSRIVKETRTQSSSLTSRNTGTCFETEKKSWQSCFSAC